MGNNACCGARRSACHGQGKLLTALGKNPYLSGVRRPYRPHTIVAIAAVGVPAYLITLACFISGILCAVLTGQMTPPVLADPPELRNACLAVMVTAGVCWWLACSQAGWYGYLCERCDSGKTSQQKLETHKKRLYGDTFSLVGKWPRPLQYLARAGFSL